MAYRRTTDLGFSFLPTDPYGGLNTISFSGGGWDGGLGGGGGGIDLGGITIGGKSPETIVDDIIDQGTGAVADWLVDQGMSRQLAETIAQAGEELGVSGINSLLDGGSQVGGGVPAGVPDDPLTEGPTAGTVYKDRDFSGTSLTLKPGLYNYNDLNPDGLHDAITSVKVKDGWEVHLYRDVEDGVPGGEKEVLQGPEEVSEIHLDDQVSAIAVRPIPGGDTTGGDGTTGTPDNESTGMNAGAVLGLAGLAYWYFA